MFNIIRVIIFLAIKNSGGIDMIKGKPFVKWAGGKRQIMPEIKKYVPENYDTKVIVETSGM